MLFPVMALQLTRGTKTAKSRSPRVDKTNVEVVCPATRLKVLVAGDQDLSGMFQSHLCPDRPQWDFTFTSDPLDALSSMEAVAPDVLVVSDRTDDDGLRLLRQARERFPGAVRILLTDATGQHPVTESGGAAQMCLSVSSDSTDLRATLVRAHRLREMLADPGIRELVGAMTTVPTLPEVYRRVTAELETPDTSVSRVGEIISQDAGMTAKILQVANSAFFAARREIADPTKAVVQVGLDVTRALVLSVGVFSAIKVKIHHREIASLWSHSLDTSLLARRIASLESPEQAFVECAFTGALLHDVGKLILAANLPEEYAAVLAEAESANEAIHAVEKRTLGATHAAVGAYLAGLWGLPGGIVCAVSCHHGPFHGCCSSLDAAGIVHVADVLDHERRSMAEDYNVALDPELLADAAFTVRVERWRALREATDFGGGH